MQRWASILLPFIGLALFAGIIAATGPARIAAVLATVHAGRLAYFPLLLVALLALRGLRWWYLLRVAGIPYRPRRAAVVWVIGFFASAVTPGKVGDAVRAVYVRDETDTSFGEAFGTVFVDRLWDLVVVLVAGVVAVLVFSHYYIRLPSIWIVLAGAAGLVALLYLMLNRRLVRALLRPIFGALVPARYKERFSLTFHSFYDSLAGYVRRPLDIVVVGGLTLAYWAVVCVLGWYVTRVLAIHVAPLYVVLIMPIITLVELLPVTVSGLGTREATVIYFFSVIGLSSAEAVGFSIAYLVLGTYVTALLGFLLWLRNPVRLAGDS